MKNLAKYLDISAALIEANKKHGVKKTLEIEVLNYISKHYILNKRIYVNDVLLLEDLASQATLHTAVTHLARKKLIILKTDPKDSRRKFVLLARAGILRLRACNSALSDLLQ